MKKVSILFVVAFALAFATSAFAIDVLLLHTYGSDYATLADDLVASDWVDSCDQFYGNTDTPELADLEGYDAVWVEGNSAWLDKVGTGDALKEYYDQGGGIVVTEGAFMTASSWGLGGDIVDNLPITGGVTTSYYVYLDDFEADHPIFDGVSAAQGAWYGSGAVLTSGATQLATWDSTDVAVAVMGHAVGLNLNGYYEAYDAGAMTMFGNALYWAYAVPQLPTVTSVTPAEGDLDTTVSVTIAGDFFIADDTTVKLASAAKADIVATNVVITDYTTLTCDFDLTGAAAGMYDLVVTKTSGDGTLEDAFEVLGGADDTAADDTAADDTAADDTDDDAADDAADDATDDTDDDTTTPVGGDDDDDDDGGCCG